MAQAMSTCHVDNVCRAAILAGERARVARAIS
jgi:hypothetical protein